MAAQEKTPLSALAGSCLFWNTQVTRGLGACTGGTLAKLGWGVQDPQAVWLPAQAGRWVSALAGCQAIRPSLKLLDMPAAGYNVSAAS